MSILKKGLTGAPVARLQRKLGINDDGIYGSGTEKAVREAQEKHGLSVDGIAGPDTFAALGLHDLVLLRVGSRGEAVKKLQQGLGIDADGKFGAGTKKAVEEFQAKHGMDADGLAGPDTLAHLDTFEEMDDRVVAQAKVQPDEAKFESEPLPDMKGSDVVAGTGTDVPEDKSVWGKVKGWFG